MDYETGQELFDALSAPFPVEMIEWRVGTTNAKFRKPDEPCKGTPLCYIDARVVMDRLDTVCGAENWQCDHVPGGAGLIICKLGIRFPGGDWVWKADGAGATDVEGEKGAISDSLKRASVRFGVARYLYDLKSPRVVLEPAGQSWRIPEAELKKLGHLHEDFVKTYGWGQRAGVQAYKLLNQAVLKKITDPGDAQQFKTDNAGMIAQLPVGMRKHLFEQLDRVGAATEAA